MKKLSAAVALLVLSAGPAWAGNVLPPGVAVPEPATLGLVAGGAIMIAAVGYRRRKKD